jgi:geranylgeranyl pyrophosphate synthase
VDLKKELIPYKKLVEKEISRHVGRSPDELYAPLRDLFSRGGKRVRPAMCMISCEACGGKREDAVGVSAVIEMIHNFTLVHDDIADKSELRRGDSCLHHKYGLGSAINCGDGLFSVAYEALGPELAKLDKERVWDIYRVLTSNVTHVCEGQALDIGWAEARIWDLDEDDYFDMIRRKTGALMSCPCEIGALIAGADKKGTKALREFGMNLGIGFQIHDDVLNLRGDVKKYGKEIGGDINEGKRSLMVIYTLNVCKEEEKERLIRILDKQRNSKEEIQNAIEIIDRYGSIDRAARIAKEKIEKGKKGLDALPDSKAKKTLLSLADYIVAREL